MSVICWNVKRGVAAALVGVALLVGELSSRAEETATVAISVKNHHFQPAEPRAPANRPVILRVKNLDSTAMEFESVSLRVEKVVAPNSEGIINLRPLSPGRYNFFDDFHQDTQGTLVVQ